MIYCLRQNGVADNVNAVNPTQPYFLVYIQDDGVVRFNFTHPKQILEIYRGLCSGQKAPFEELCKLFNEQTHNGTDMTIYNDLLKKAVTAIENSYRKRTTGKLQEGRGAVLPGIEEQVTEKTDFELISWLVIR